MIIAVLNPVEVLTFSGFCSQLLKIAFKTAMIMAYLTFSCVL